MTNSVIAVVGLAGTGKSELTRLLTSMYAFRPVYFGGCILEEVRRRELPLTSENERIVREDLRARHGMHVVAELAYPLIQELLTAGSNVVIDGLYSGSEYGYLKRKLESDFFILGIHAPKGLRYERLANRQDRSLQPIEVDLRDQLELKKLDKCEPIVMADYHIINDASIDDLAWNLGKIMQSLGYPTKMPE